MFEVRFAYTRNQAQSLRTSRPETVFTFDTEAEAIAALKTPPAGAKAGMARQLTPECRFLKRRMY
jgi:hypothetical protein